jgi:hypothetical protein
LGKKGIFQVLACPLKVRQRQGRASEILQAPRGMFWLCTVRIWWWAIVPVKWHQIGEGTFLTSKALSLGVPKGPAISNLMQHGFITLENGQLVSVSNCLSDPLPGIVCFGNAENFHRKEARRHGRHLWLSISHGSGTRMWRADSWVHVWQFVERKGAAQHAFDKVELSCSSD